ncbi:hypothetical protein DL93DRAFT_2076157 [Clavulina sp. PMI_390]|nr:hypothetical protein DL93DRAFT_2076157 [Clavulina sp. PMI_390]
MSTGAPTASEATLPSTRPQARPTGTHAHVSHASAPLSFFHPTRAEGKSSSSSSQFPDDGEHDIQWRSRASRKRLFVPKDVSVQRDHRAGSAPPASSGDAEKTGETGGTNAWLATLRVHNPSQHNLNIRHKRMHLRVAGDISFWVALIFVLGSIAWVINGFLLFLPLLPATNTGPQEYEAAAWAFVGGSLFEIGAYLALVEALNTGHEAMFGTEVERLLEGEKAGEGKFIWMGVRSRRDLGYLACAIQMFAASIFWVSTLTGLPGVIPGFFTSTATPAIVDVFFWTPQVIGGSGFIIASALLMLEEQKAWWKLNLTSVGWQVGLWNLIGAAGFTLCAAFGYGSVAHTWMDYQSVLCTFWGSWAFLIGSLLQLAETLVREE